MDRKEGEHTREKSASYRILGVFGRIMLDGAGATIDQRVKLRDVACLRRADQSGFPGEGSAKKEPDRATCNRAISRIHCSFSK